MTRATVLEAFTAGDFRRIFTYASVSEVFDGHHQIF